jgi:purine catabolism regulator
MSKKMVTLNELLEIKDFAERVILVNKQGNLNNQITHVTIMEGPDLYEWVTGGEFVLTTWYAFSKNPELQEIAFQKLAPRISAIGIKTGRFIDKIPLKILQLADQYQLPVFEVKTAVKFRELVQTITSEIQNYQTNMLIEVEKNYQKLIHTSLNSDDLASLVNVLGNQLHKSCFCLNHEGKLLASWGKRGIRKQDFFDWIEKIKAGFKERIYTDAGFCIDELHVFECYARNQLVGQFVIAAAGPLTEKERLIGQQGASFLAIKLWDHYETLQKTVERFWKEIKNGAITQGEVIAEKLTGLGFNQHEAYNLVLFSKGSHDIRYYLLNKFLIEEEKFYILLCDSKAALAIVNIFKKYNKEQNKVAVAVISPEFTELGQIKEHYEMSVNVISLLYKLHISGVRKAEEWLPFSLLMHCRNTAEYNFIKSTVLDKLLEYDRRYQASLLDTLTAALQENSLEDAAERQHIHINTLRYRLGKIKEITQKNYFKMTDRYFLLICIMIQRMEHEQL